MAAQLDYDRNPANAVFRANKKPYNEFMRLFAVMKADAAKINEGRTMFADDKYTYQNTINNITKFLNKGFGERESPKGRAAAARELLEQTSEFVAGLLARDAKYKDAEILTRKYMTTIIRKMEKLVDGKEDIEDAFNTFEHIPDSEKKSIDKERVAYEKIKKEFNALKLDTFTPKNDTPSRQHKQVIEQRRKENRQFINLYRRYMQRAGVRTPVTPNVKSAPTVPIFCQGFEPQRFDLVPQIASNFASKAECLKKFEVGQRYEELCARVDEPSKLTLAQTTPYYYSNPNNPTSILLTHSAGAGKTAAMTLACSLFVRAGYLPIIVTTEALAADNTYERAIFVECADWNIQQLLHSSGTRSMIDLVEGGADQPTVEDVIATGRGLYQKMAEPQIWNPALKITFKTFSVLCKSLLTNYKPHMYWSPEASAVWHILCNRGAPSIKGKMNFLWKTVILMDEVQTMMDERPPKGTTLNDTTPYGDIRNVILALWQARETTNEGPVVIAASATPGKSEFELAMILNMLCTASDGYNFADRRYYGFGVGDPSSYYYHDQKGSLSDAFKAAHPDPKKILAKMALGRVSYYDSSASKSVPPMRIVPVNVELTGEQQRTQAELLQQLKTSIRLVQKRDGSWEIERDFGDQFRGITRNNTQPLKDFTDGVKGNSIVAKTNAGKFIMEKVKASGYFLPPKVRGGRDEYIRTRADYAKWKEIAPIIAPLYTRTIDCLRMNKAKGIRKQYVYINLDASAEQGSELFCKMLGSLLRYKDVEASKDTTVYSGNYARVTVRNSSKMLDLYNSPENANGSLVDIIVLDRTTKEGVSLYGVGAVYIVGVVDSETDLVQSVARAFRNCRTDPDSLYPTKDVPVLLVTPFANGSPIHSILLSVNKADIKQELKPKDLLKILKEASFDKEILATENSASEAANSKLTMYLK